MDKTQLDFIMPKGWDELTQRKLRYVFRLIADGFTVDEIKTMCLFRWNEAEVIGKESNGIYLVQLGKEHFNLKVVEIAMILPYLDWLGALPPMPVRLERIKGHKAIAADFQGVPFETYIVCDNLFQGVLAALARTENGDMRNETVTALLCQLAEVLYPGLNCKPSTLNNADKVSIFYWIGSLKDFFSKRFHHFYGNMEQETGNLLAGSQFQISGSRLQEAMDAQIRALTKGDITKESEILALDTWRALTELNAQAKEYKELKAAYNGKH